MGKYISLGEYNKLYKYIWIYLAIRLVTQIVLDYGFIFDQLKIDAMNIPYSPLISIQFYYIGFIIFSLILLALEKFYKNKEPNQDPSEAKLIFNKQDIEVEFGFANKDYYIFVIIFFTVIIDISDEIFGKFQCSILDYWMFEMFFFEKFISKFLRTKIYRHHIFSLIFILSSCSLILTINIIISFANNTEDVQIFNNRKWLIPLGIIVYLLSQIFRAYTYCYEKYFLEKKVISITNFLLVYGIFGIIASVLCATISTFVPCGDNTLPELSKIICNFKDDNETYYFDSYIIHFKSFASEYFGVKITLKIITSILFYASNYYVIVIYKKLSPIYHICMKKLNSLIINILFFMNNLINDKIGRIDITKSILDILILIFYILGSIVYLEFIELNFWNLNFYTKRKIKERSNTETSICLDEISENSELSRNETNEN